MQKEKKDQVEREKNCLLELERLKNQDQEREVQLTRIRLMAESKTSSSGSSGDSFEQSGLLGMVKFLPKFSECDRNVFFTLKILSLIAIGWMKIKLCCYKLFLSVKLRRLLLHCCLQSEGIISVKEAVLNAMN